jgi:hypothetical protein
MARDATTKWPQCRHGWTQRIHLDTPDQTRTAGHVTPAPRILCSSPTHQTLAPSVRNPPRVLKLLRSIQLRNARATFHSPPLYIRAGPAKFWETFSRYRSRETNPARKEQENPDLPVAESASRGCANLSIYLFDSSCISTREFSALLRPRGTEPKLGSFPSILFPD